MKLIRLSIINNISIFILFLFAFITRLSEFIGNTLTTVSKIAFYIIFFLEIASAVFLLLRIISPLDSINISIFREIGKTRYSISCLFTFIIYISMASVFIYKDMLFNATGAVVVLVWLYLTYDKVMQTVFKIE